MDAELAQPQHEEIAYVLPVDLQEFLVVFKCRHTSPQGSTQAVLTLITQELRIFNNKVSIRLHFNLTT